MESWILSLECWVWDENENEKEYRKYTGEKKGEKTQVYHNNMDG